MRLCRTVVSGCQTALLSGQWLVEERSNSCGNLSAVPKGVMNCAAKGWICFGALSFYDKYGAGVWHKRGRLRGCW